MTTQKITTFLMCPTSTPNTAGGTPQLGACAGGHIKKSAWIGVHDAALSALAPLIEQAEKREHMHWSATPVEVDADLLMASLLIAMWEGQCAAAMESLALEEVDETGEAGRRQQAAEHEGQGIGSGQLAGEEAVDKGRAEHDKTEGEHKGGEGGGHGSGLNPKGRETAVQLAFACAMKLDQLLTDFEPGVLRLSTAYGTDRGLSDAADRRNLLLGGATRAEFGDEFCPVHGRYLIERSIDKQAILGLPAALPSAHAS